MSYTPINKGQFSLETPEREAEFDRRRGSDDLAAYAENRRLWTELPRTKTVTDYPQHVDIELASLCNLRCPMCYTITEEFKQRVNAKLMDYDLFTRIVDQCAEGGVYSIRLSLRGESFLHKRIVDCIRYAKQKGIKEVSSLTNGLRLDEEMFTEAMEAGLDWISISIDGMGETYEAIRKPAKFDRVVEKLKNFKKIKEDNGRLKPVIKVQSIYPAIAENPAAFYDTFAPICDFVATNPLIDYLRNDDKNKIFYHEDFSCPQIYQRMTIAADGQVMLCANDENNEYVIGDANTQSIHEIWHGEKMRFARESHACHRGYAEVEPCKHCYLPRRTEPCDVTVGERQLTIENYLNRSQEIGT